MLTIDKTAVMNLENAIRGARNPMNSWEKMDSDFDGAGRFVLGENDLRLARSLCRAGSDHRKFIRQIFVSADITAPLYWWKEFDTYKIATVANSTSTMHKIHTKEFSLSDFSADGMTEESLGAMEALLTYLERLRLRYLETKDKRLWYDIIQLLPAGYNQLRTVTMNYENLSNMYFARKNHKLSEWHTLCDWIRTLPYAADLILRGADAD